MNAIIIYYSLDWNTKMISEVIWSELKAEMEAIETAQQLDKPESFMQYVSWIRMILLNKLPEIKPLKSNLNEYGLIIIWTPIWAWKACAPVLSLLTKFPLKNRKMAIFCCHWSPSISKALYKMREELAWNEIIWETDFREPMKIDTEIQIEKAKAWAKWILNNLT
ncbi:MAG: hypothetical protein ACD_2C00041G0001 [uncultured bacterium (gcode 4)]|uniref:Flavodoxin n=1 Tax=uncultured bacterium (gcode 4) TaxID=1234023 RepID=K2G4E7_9BACT|nr:MAG: hypothetical protein ACD_2C00041G0001 [uncultured bacterium (gcode 4)]